MSNSVESTTSGIDIPMEVPGSYMEPDVLETLYLAQHGLSDNCRRLVQTSDYRTQSVYLIDDTSNQLDTEEDCEHDTQPISASVGDFGSSHFSLHFHCSKSNKESAIIDKA